MQYLRSIAIAAALAAACGGSGGSDDADGGVPELDAAALPADAGPDAAPPAFSGIDILFVINDSLGIVPSQYRLGDHMAGFLDALEAAEGELPSLHVGVVSTTVQSSSSLPPCSGSRGGDLDARACLTDTARFASTESGNYAGTLAEAAACMMRLGEFGCPFEQPLEAMRRALDGSRPGNAGFLRDDALLVVVFMTDEDDCSAANSDLFHESAFELGPFTSFRCFEHGVRCDQPDPRAPGPRTGCRPADDGIMYGVDQYAAFLDELKGGPGRVVVAGLIPAESPITVRIDQGDPLLTPLCPETGVQSWPTVRMHAFARQVTASAGAPLGAMCEEDWAVPLAELAQHIADVYRE